MLKPYLLLFSLILNFSFCFSQPSSTFPHGEIKGPFIWKSNIYPGTERNYWIYVPVQYNKAKPACVMVVQDGLSRAEGWNLPNVLDSLIEIDEIPVIIGIFIDPGIVPASTPNTYPRYNRSFEYDAMGDRYAKFLLDELLPEVGRSYNLSSDPNDRSIAGASSGAICAFNVAWERPDEFRRVLSTIGTYVGLRGGDTFATLVRKSEPKPLRIFLADGDHDLNIYAGDWWLANQDMNSALSWAGYELNHAWGTGGHNSEHAKIILPQALKWLWEDYPAPISAGRSQNKLMRLLPENEPWEKIESGDAAVKRLATDAHGSLYFTANEFVYKMDDKGKPSEFVQLDGKAGGLSYAHDGKLYIGNLTEKKIITVNENKVSSNLIENVSPNFMTISQKGIYFSETDLNRIGFYSFDKREVQYTTVPGKPTGLSINAEQTFLNVGLADYTQGYSYKISETGSLEFGQDYIHFQIPYGALTADVQGMCTDSENILYSATNMGIQISDQLGRINFILNEPEGNVTDIKFGGKDFDILYVNYSGKLYSRKINAKGILSWQAAVNPPKPKM